MTDDSYHPSHGGDTGSPQQPQADSSLETLRDILFGRYRRQIAELEAELDDLERRITDEDVLTAMIAPVLGDAIRRKIRDARDEMVEALYPIIGQLVVRSVSVAIRDLVRTIDARMRISFSPRAIWRRLQARLSGVSGAELVLRESLPFEVAEVFLIHHETGLLLRHVSRDPNASPDSDLISGMLTAIRDFVQDAFARGKKEGQLEEIQYGERRILIEAAQHAYLAVVVDGIEPAGFRDEMRHRLMEVVHAHEKTLRHYDGDPTPLASVEESLRSLMMAARPPELSRTQKRVLVGALALLVVCPLVTCLAGRWAWGAVRATPTPLPVVEPTFTLTPSPTSTATTTPSLTPTATPSPTLTATSTSSPTPTATSTPSSTPTATPSPTSTCTSTPLATASPMATLTPAPVIGLMTGHVWLRAGPSADSPRPGVILERGQQVEILALFGDWYWVRWTPQAGAEVTGWVPVKWVGTVSPIPSRIVTPTASP